MNIMRCPFLFAQEYFKEVPLVIAEVGVAFGDNAALVYDGLKPKEFHLIDNWEWDGASRVSHGAISTKDEMYAFAVGQLNHLPGVRFVPTTSKRASLLYPKEYFHLVYIDADHEYEGVQEDLISWYPKVKPGGIFGGDDFDPYPGVKRAVEEFARQEQLKLYVGQSRTQWWVIKPKEGE